MLIYVLQAVIAAIVWVVANVVYADMKRKGIHGFTRFAAFWAGTPTTWVTLFALPEHKEPEFRAPPDDDESELLAEIRRDRALRAPAPEPPEEAVEAEATRGHSGATTAGRVGDESARVDAVSPRGDAFGLSDDALEKESGIE